MDGGTECQMDGRRARWTDGGSDGRTECQMDGRRVRWTDGVPDGRTEGQMDGQTSIYPSETAAFDETGDELRRDDHHFIEAIPG